ncbi:hypothetical protein AB0H81_17945, partial [Nonomuraea sp. NPDC050691]
MRNVKTAVKHVTSADGTAIAYRTLGSGPGLVLLHGMMQSGPSNIELARALAGTPGWQPMTPFPHRDKIVSIDRPEGCVGIGRT